MFNFSRTYNTIKLFKQRELKLNKFLPHDQCISDIYKIFRNNTRAGITIDKPKGLR